MLLTYLKVTVSISPSPGSVLEFQVKITASSHSMSNISNIQKFVRQISCRQGIVCGSPSFVCDVVFFVLPP